MSARPACPKCGTTDPDEPRTTAAAGLCFDVYGCQRRQWLPCPVCNAAGSYEVADIEHGVKRVECKWCLGEREVPVWKTDPKKENDK